MLFMMPVAPLLCVQFRLRLNSGELESSPGDCPHWVGEDTGRRGQALQQLQYHHPVVQRPREEAGGVWGAVLTGGTGWEPESALSILHV